MYKLHDVCSAVDVSMCSLTNVWHFFQISHKWYAVLWGIREGV